jgi:hypothetical protein
VFQVFENDTQRKELEDGRNHLNIKKALSFTSLYNQEGKANPTNYSNDVYPVESSLLMSDA